MGEKIKFFFNQDTLLTLEEHFEDLKDETLHRFIFVNLRKLAETSKTSDAQRAFNANVFDEKGQITQQVFPYKENKLEEFVLKSNPDWRPKDLEPEETGEFILSVGDKTHNHLSNYCKIHMARVAKFNDTVPKIDGKIDPRYKPIPDPTCMEEILHEALQQPVMELIVKAAQELFDKENEEIEKAQAESEAVVQK